jgi:hypothetical protein
MSEDTTPPAEASPPKASKAAAAAAPVTIETVTILTEATRDSVTGIITMPTLRTVPADEVPEGAEILGEPGGPREPDGFVPVIDPISRALVWIDPGDVKSGTVCAVEGVHY